MVLWNGMNCIGCAEPTNSPFSAIDGLCWVCRRLRVSVRYESGELVRSESSVNCLVLAARKKVEEDDDE
jgi:hypothetical protein